MIDDTQCKLFAKIRSSLDHNGGEPIDISDVTTYDFVSYIDAIDKEFKSRITFVNNRNEDLVKLEHLDLSTIDIKAFRLTEGLTVYRLALNDINDLAMLVVYRNDTYKQIMNMLASFFVSEYSVIFGKDDECNGSRLFTKVSKATDLLTRFPKDVINNK